MWRRGGLSWWQLAVRVWRAFWDGQLAGRCAELAYYFLFSVFPLLLFLTTLIGYLAGPESKLRSLLFRYLDRFSPSAEVTELLRSTLDQVIAGRGGARLSLSLLVALWVASVGMLAVGRTLNLAFEIEETRPWWKRRLEAAALTVGFAVMIICALTVILYGHHIGEAIAGAMGLGSAFVSGWRLVRWPLVLVFALLSFDSIYNFAPDVGPALRRYWATPGAVIGMSLWLAVTFGFRLYLYEMREYGATTYGSLTAVIVLLLWFYLTALAILVGGEVNSVIVKQIPALRRRIAGKAAPGAGGARGATSAGGAHGATGAGGAHDATGAGGAHGGKTPGGHASRRGGRTRRRGRRAAIR
jgi:membrane protein